MTPVRHEGENLRYMPSQCSATGLLPPQIDGWEGKAASEHKPPVAGSLFSLCPEPRCKDSDGSRVWARAVKPLR